MLVRCLAVASIGWAMVELALYFAICRHNHDEVNVVPCLVKSLPLLAGVAMLIKSKSLAEWISNLLDD